MTLESLAIDVRGDGPPVVLVHGFTQTARCWGPLADQLAVDHRVIAVDAPGHGRSAAVRADLWEGAELVADAGGPATYVGYSMGGRLALHVALARPDVVERLVLVGATGGIEDPDARAARRRRDDALADRIETIGVAAFVDEWLALPMFAGLAPGARFVAERCTNTAEGLASSLRLAGTGTQDPLWDRLGSIGAPTLVTAGADDAAFVPLAARLAEAIGPPARVALIPGAGHTAHLEQPAAFTAVLDRWLSDPDRSW